MLSFIGFTVVIIYYITVADTSTFVLGMLSERGKLNPSTKIKITWGLIQSITAAVLLLIGGLNILQTASLIVAFPLAIILIFVCWSLLKELKIEADEIRSNQVHEDNLKIDSRKEKRVSL
jgi:glycine betaine transporter